ncbi:hypothetical protein F0U62_45010 [Cystobacter fuscus]|uniref:hypothetical protein n=1 Tax=Cystobacter fuscus TaxID=43 RepID=UPI002B301474|nr:hypothetical protein F0U62_45010 [Cystobacter fuscus]
MFLSVALCLALPMTVLQPAGPIEALSGSWTSSRPHRMNLFLVLVVCGALLIVAGLFDTLLGLGNQGTARLIVATVLSQFLNGVAAALADDGARPLLPAAVRLVAALGRGPLESHGNILKRSWQHKPTVHVTGSSPPSHDG